MRILPLLLVAIMFSSNLYAESVVPIETIVLEAQGESLDGQIAVGEVIRNRAFKASRTHESVCLSPKQFSCFNDRKQARKALSRASGDVWQRASRAWAESETSNLTHGATHYHTLTTKPYWAKGHKPSVIIGSHAFYEGIK